MLDLRDTPEVASGFAFLCEAGEQLGDADGCSRSERKSVKAGDARCSADVCRNKRKSATGAASISACTGKDLLEQFKRKSIHVEI